MTQCNYQKKKNYKERIIGTVPLVRCPPLVIRGDFHCRTSRTSQSHSMRQCGQRPARHCTKHCQQYSALPAILSIASIIVWQAERGSGRRQRPVASVTDVCCNWGLRGHLGALLKEGLLARPLCLQLVTGLVNPENVQGQKLTRKLFMVEIPYF
jgi:hypothetical protein